MTMSPFFLYLAWFADVLVLSLLLALLEINMEKDRGWGATLNSNGLGRKVRPGRLFLGVVEKQYVTVYHLLMYGIILPGVIAAHWVALYLFWSKQGLTVTGSGLLTVWHIGSTSLAPFLLAIAAWLAICTIEDFLWFALNWYYPASLRDLLAGKIWWHTQWVRIGRSMLPRFYVWTLIIAAGLLAVAYRLSA